MPGSIIGNKQYRLQSTWFLTSVRYRFPWLYNVWCHTTIFLSGCNCLCGALLKAQSQKTNVFSFFFYTPLQHFFTVPYPMYSRFSICALALLRTASIAALLQHDTLWCTISPQNPITQSMRIRPWLPGVNLSLSPTYLHKLITCLKLANRKMTRRTVFASFWSQECHHYIQFSSPSSHHIVAHQQLTWHFLHSYSDIVCTTVFAAC